MTISRWCCLLAGCALTACAADIGDEVDPSSDGASSASVGGAGGGATGTTGGTGASTSTSTSAGSGGDGGAGAPTCTRRGAECSSEEYCDFDDDLCGADIAGHCKPRPDRCGLVLTPTCACDGRVYGNECDAAMACHDASNAGGCAAPEGQFACGHGFCLLASEYCVRIASDVDEAPDSYACVDLPVECNSGPAVPSCACIETACVCSGNASTGFVVECPGG